MNSAFSLSDFEQDAIKIDQILADNYSIDDFSILITGALGSLLTYLSFYLARLSFKKNGIKIYIYARSKHKYSHYFNDCTNVYFVDGNDLKSLKNSNIKIDYIIHGAGPGLPTLTTDNMNALVDANINLTLEVLNFCSKNNVKKFIYISSGAIYGKNGAQEEVSEKFSGIFEISNKTTLYGSLKYSAEILCDQYLTGLGIPFCILRPAHNYGPSHNISKDQRLMALILKSLISNEVLTLNPDIDNKRSFVHYIDFTTALFHTTFTKSLTGVFNISNHDTYMSVRDLLIVVKNHYPEFRYQIKPANGCISTNCMLMRSDYLMSQGWKPVIDITTGIEISLKILT